MGDLRGMELHAKASGKITMGPSSSDIFVDPQENSLGIDLRVVETSVACNFRAQYASMLSYHSQIAGAKEDLLRFDNPSRTC